MPNVSRRMLFAISSAMTLMALKVDFYLCVNSWNQREKARIIQIEESAAIPPSRYYRKKVTKKKVIGKSNLPPFRKSLSISNP
jgi:hypothetical protein